MTSVPFFVVVPTAVAVDERVVGFPGLAFGGIIGADDREVVSPSAVSGSCGEGPGCVAGLPGEAGEEGESCGGHLCNVLDLEMGRQTWRCISELSPTLPLD